MSWKSTQKVGSESSTYFTTEELKTFLQVYMVRFFYEGEEHSEQKIAQLTGILAASQSFFRSLSAYGWGILLDKVGRKVSRRGYPYRIPC